MAWWRARHSCVSRCHKIGILICSSSTNFGEPRMRDDRLPKALSTESRLLNTRSHVQALQGHARRSSCALYSTAFTRTGGTPLHYIALPGDICEPRAFPTPRARASMTCKTRLLGAKSDKVSFKLKLNWSIPTSAMYKYHVHWPFLRGTHPASHMRSHRQWVLIRWTLQKSPSTEAP